MKHNIPLKSLASLERIRRLASAGEVRISEHGYNELSEDNISVRGVVTGLQAAELVEDYPAYPKGSCVLVLVRDRGGNPVHALRGIPAGKTTPAVLVTAYRPDPKRWQSDFKRRRQ